MLIITNIETMKVDHDIHEIMRLPPWDYVPINDCTSTVAVEALRELISGRRFRRPSDGLDVVLGYTKQAQDTIGITYEAFANQEMDIARQQKEITVLRKNCDTSKKEVNALQTELRAIKRANFLTRLKWLFRGAVNHHPQGGG